MSSLQDWKLMLTNQKTQTNTKKQENRVLVRGSSVFFGFMVLLFVVKFCLLHIYIFLYSYMVFDANTMVFEAK